MSTRDTPMVLDLAILQESCLHDDDLIQEIILTTQEDLPANLALLRQALSRQDFTSAQRAAHSIKSVARQLGGLALAEHMHPLEQQLATAHSPAHEALASAETLAEAFLKALSQVQKAAV